jgi:DNA-binding PadR family transcriptional regulator
MKIDGGVLRPARSWGRVAGAVLGLVIEKPSHGYEIPQRFEEIP